MTGRSVCAAAALLDCCFDGRTGSLKAAVAGSAALLPTVASATTALTADPEQAAQPRTTAWAACVYGFEWLQHARAPDQRVDLRGLDLVHFAHRISDLALVCAHVHNEDQRVVVLDLLHRRLSRERVLEDRELVERVDLRHGLARVLRVAQQAQGLRPVEGGRVPLLDALLDGLAREGLGRRLCLSSRSSLSSRLSSRRLQQRNGSKHKVSKYGARIRQACLRAKAQAEEGSPYSTCTTSKKTPNCLPHYSSRM